MKLNTKKNTFLNGLNSATRAGVAGILPSIMATNLALRWSAIGLKIYQVI